MQNWNTGPFDNEDAAEVLEDVRSGELYLEELLPGVGNRYIEADQGAIIVALAHLAGGDLPEGITPEQVTELQTPEVKERLRECLGAVLSDGTVSELAAQWAEEGTEQLYEWKAKAFISLG
ncbi:DUF4259 domain-containing protein [Corynebacterium sp. YIM 101645]|uniref:DUF4259 domain-containing protein n=1 Tax=Corynebacterium lemuris TaxID=1859292 RepID=A0ABT2FXI5_9CORY|nr:DUF4259 domain-containing protein [Corynebacterium lemuris]MCS5479950.1 DUF4259 domain-containing protein [Corynebacterium lemuris]